MNKDAFIGWAMIAFIYWIFAYPVADYNNYSNEQEYQYANDLGWYDGYYASKGTESYGEFEKNSKNREAYKISIQERHKLEKKERFRNWLSLKEQAYKLNLPLFPYVQENSK